VSAKSAPALITELWELVKAYVQQELAVPLRGLGRYVGYGLAGSLLVGIGSFLVALGLLRVLQTETDGWFDGHWEFVPYLVVAVLSVAVAALALTRAASKEHSYD
jgi:hypothetical protein